MEVSWLAAAAAGLVSFLSPCVLPLVPPYLAYLAGTTVEEVAERGESEARRDVLVASLLFVAGFTTVFVTLGATASVVGGLIRAWSQELAVVAGLAIVAMGLHFTGLVRIGAMAREKRLTVEKPVGLWSAYLMGLAFAFGWTPCIGPILAAILAVAAAEQTALSGAALLAVYSAGLGIPFVLAAAAMGRFMGFSRRFRSQFGRMEKVAGVALILTGVAFLTGGMQTASFWLLETFPALGRLG